MRRTGTRLLSLFFLASFLIITGCGEPPQGDASSDDQLVMARFMDSTTVAKVTELKARFDQGLQDYGGQERALSYLYQQHALRLRGHFLEEEPFHSLYPFDGRFQLGDHASLIREIPFFSDACGFRDANGKEVNYYCPAMNPEYFAYLESLGTTNEIIQNFANDYQQYKTISPAVRQQMLLSAPDVFNFASEDEQLFYALMHTWVNEEMQARLSLTRNQNPPAAPASGGETGGTQQ
ncbi:hypothetical protein [Lewinella sp. W8]|uniref:hypothetical protein n=1 Tax=Lewinella sp. W8 TaxID=2528208 RepID=UPI00106850DA|nr:hypothetical protein [Lewinella sp. W8]MTB50239.1 hypothetical protein [Lewinella sp. W8]